MDISIPGGVSYNQTQKVVEDRNGLRNDPGDDPNGQCDANPRSNSQSTPLVHVMRPIAAENADVDIFARNMAEDDSGDDNLVTISRVLWWIRKRVDDAQLGWQGHRQPSSSPVRRRTVQARQPRGLHSSK